MPLFGTKRLELFSFALDLSHLEVSSFLRSMMHSDVPMMILNCGQFELTLLVSDLLHSEVLLLVKSFSHLDLAPSTFSFSQLEVLPSTRSCVCLETLVSIFGMSCVDFLFMLPVIHSTNLDLFLFVQSLAQFNLASSAFDYASMDFLLSLKTFCHLGFFSFLLGVVHVDSPPFIADLANMDVSSSTQSLVYLELPLLMSSTTSLDFSMVLQGPCCMGSVASVLGLACVDLIFLLFVIEDSQFDSFLFIRAFA